MQEYGLGERHSQTQEIQLSEMVVGFFLLSIHKASSYGVRLFVSILYKVL